MADYCFGVNESRLAGIRLKKRGLAVGRVQTPTLGLVVARDEQIENHIKEKYYELSADVSMQGYDKVDFAFHPDKKYMSDNELSYITDREWLDGIGSSFDGKDVDITVTEKPKTTAPPLPYNLTALQSEMNRRFGYTAAKTLNITQSLRTKKAITYNRSDSRYLKEEHYRQAPSLFAKILGGSLTDRYDLDFSIHSACFNDKNVTAHHGIIPQEVNISLKSLTKDEKNVYLAICDRYAQQFMKPLKQMVSTAQFPVPDGKYAHKFEHTSYKTLDAGYTAYFGRDKDEEDSEKGIYIPKGNYEGNVTGHSIIEKETRPPARYTEGTLIKDMSSISKYVTDPEIKAILKRKDEGKKGENGSIGTVATRSTIIDALVKRGFLAREGKNLVSTQLGRDFYHVLPPEISKADTTAKWWLIQEAIIDGEETDPNAIQQSVLEEFNRHKDTAYEGMSLNQEKEKVTGIWNGNEISFNRVWGEYTFSDEEAEKLLAGEKITINVKGRQVTGSLAEQTYRKHKFVGFKADITPKSEQEGYVTGTWNGKEVAFKREWGGHTFTDEEIEHLLAGEEITIRSKSKKGRDYEATGKLAWQSFRGIKFFGFKADFGKKKKE